MQQDIVQAVNSAKTDKRRADSFIRQYIPFILSQASKTCGRSITQQDDEFSIAMIAFHRAIQDYDSGKGAFLNYASMIIHSRIIDYLRKEAKHSGSLSMDRTDEEGQNPAHSIADRDNPIEDGALEAATKAEIEELAAVMAQFGVSFTHVAENCPKQERTLAACAKAIAKAGQDKELLDTLLKTKKLPMAQLEQISNVSRKTLERHRKYILAMLLIQTNGYEIIRGHLMRMLRKGGALN